MPSTNHPVTAFVCGTSLHFSVVSAFQPLNFYMILFNIQYNFHSSTFPVRPNRRYRINSIPMVPTLLLLTSICLSCTTMRKGNELFLIYWQSEKSVYRLSKKLSIQWSAPLLCRRQGISACRSRIPSWWYPRCAIDHPRGRPEDHLNRPDKRRDPLPEIRHTTCCQLPVCHTSQAGCTEMSR